MTDGPWPKKARVWNPALDSDVISKRDGSENEVELEKNPIDFSKNSNPMLPLLVQNYIHLAPLMARIHQQRQIDELLRRHQMMNTFPVTTNIRTVCSLPSTITSQSQSSSSSLGTIVNPLVQSALGTPLVNENCCAICGAIFRLTGDLVQHMRNNHRRTKFRRKNEKNFT